MEKEAHDVLKIISFMSVIFICLTRIGLFLILIVLNEEGLPLYLVFYSYSLNLYYALITMGLINIFCALLVFVCLNKNFWHEKTERYLWRIISVILLFQPILLTILGILLLIYIQPERVLEEY